ncbi:MAG: hypothetical protein Q8L09_03580 [Candidatus Moranbacteria bacterium]|nr:hypothetical protein [Candidatus Moranbacteria bacterium]
MLSEKKFENRFYIFGLAILFCGLMFFSFSEKAEAKTVTDGNLAITYSDPLFAVTNAVPGQTYFSDMTVENLGGADRKFQFELNIAASSSNLTERLFLKIYSLDEIGKEYCEYGCLANEDIKSLDGGEFEIKTMPGNSTKNFRFALAFDPDAGNDFQNVSAGFDMKIGFEDEFQGVTGGGGGGNGATAAGTAPTGFLTSLFSAVSTGTTAGAETEGEMPQGQEGEVKGEETTPGQVEGISVSSCQSWPKWIWVLMLIAYFAAFLWRTFSNLSGQIEKREMRWGWQAILAGVAFLVWYFFDKCREFQWFVIIALVGGAVVYLFYLYLFRNNIREEHADIESGSGQEPPENPTDQASPIV